MVVAVDQRSARLMGEFGAARVRVHVQVIGANTLRLATSERELQQPVAGIDQGLSIIAGDGIVSLWWSGELWAIGNAPNTYFDIEVIR